MKIDRTCNLVMSLPRDEGGKIHIHSAPLSRIAFEEYAMLFGKTFAMIHEAMGANFAPRFAATMLKEAAAAMMPTPSSPEQVERNRIATQQIYGKAMAEIRRLTNVIVPTEKGWDTMPLDDAVRRDMFDEDELSEVENAIVFFTLAWRSYPKADRMVMTGGAARYWGGSITSSNITEYANSLPTSTEPANSGANPAPGSLVPS